jgi:hypothetical protein
VLTDIRDYRQYVEDVALARAHASSVTRLQYTKRIASVQYTKRIASV